MGSTVINTMPPKPLTEPQETSSATTADDEKVCSEPLDKDETDHIDSIIEKLSQKGMKAKPSTPRHDTLRRASVMVLITKDGKVLLTQRTMKLRSHPGEVCFPGGKQDEEDKGDDVVTALRETYEECGLDFRHQPPSLPLLCSMPTVESINHLCVTPIVAFVHETADKLNKKLVLNHDEVAHAFWAPLSYFWRVEPDEEYDIEWSGGVFVFRRYNFQYTKTKSFAITGLTAHMIYEVAKAAFSDDDGETTGSTRQRKKPKVN